MRMSDMRAATGPVPQAAFGAENIVGTPIPRIGSTNARPNYASSVGTGNANKWQLIGIAAAFIVLGYVAWHVYLKLE